MTDSESGDSSGEDPEGSKVSAWDLLLSGPRVLGGGLFLCLVSREAEMKAQRRRAICPMDVSAWMSGGLQLAWLPGRTRNRGWQGGRLP